MNVGTIGYATDQGLGILIKSFHDAGVVNSVFLVRHSRRHNHDEWYPKAPWSRCSPFNTELAKDFCRAQDLMLFFETPFDWNLIAYCKQHGVKTALMPMYECMPKDIPCLPDKIICPSALDLDYFPNTKEIPSKFIPVPVQGIPWRQRKHARIFIHNAGNGGLKGRNGTQELLKAIPLVRSPAKFIIRSQVPIEPLVDDSRIEYEIGTMPQEELYARGDVFVFPEKFNGLSLPLQEAWAAGMLVMATDRYPMNDWLPNEPLITAADYKISSISGRCVEFREAIIDPKDIAITIDEFFNTDISEYSLTGKYWAEEMSWNALKPRYMEFLQS
jgi:glycosyltransferase involved in cell wall biosynthesis